VLLAGLVPVGSQAEEARPEVALFDSWLRKPVDLAELARLLPAAGPASREGRPG
jgi:hypothetical protein